MENGFFFTFNSQTFFGTSTQINKAGYFGVLMAEGDSTVKFLISLSLAVFLEFYQ